MLRVPVLEVKGECISEKFSKSKPRPKKKFARAAPGGEGGGGGVVSIIYKKPSA